MSTKSHIAFDGDWPEVRDGDAVEVRADGHRGTEWIPTVARSEPRYDDAMAIGPRCYLTVAVEWNGRVVNWPAEHVRLAADLGETP